MAVIARNPWLIALFLGCALTGRAQQAAPIADFSAGFQQLAGLGLPPLDAKASWAVVPEDYRSGTELRQVAKSVKGNGWLLPTATGDKPRAIACGGLEPIDLKAGSKRPAEPDLTKDVEALIAGLKKIATKMDPEDRYSYGMRSSNFGSFLLFAVQLHQTGHPALANQLALAVFEVFPSREAAVDAAINLLAGQFYEDASRAFFTSGDWAAYHTALAALCKRFPRGWSSHDAVGMFMPQLEKQAAGATPPVPSLPGVAIDPRALAIIAEFTAKPNPPGSKDKKPRAISAAMRYRMNYDGEGYGGDSSGPPPLWIISEPAEADDADAKASPLIRLAALKMAAIPALAALAADPFLTCLPNSRSSSGYSSYSSSNDSADDISLRLYESLNRPATRGEIATQLLAATLPQSDDDRSQGGQDAISETALAFWKDYKDATREELAVIFLRDGSSNQSAQAASILAASSEPKAHQAFEAHVLAADPAIATFQDVQTYLRARKAAARPFFDAYAKLVRSQAKGGSSDNDDSNQYAWAIKQAGGTAKILKQLEALVGGQSPRALAIQIAKGKPADAKAAINSLSSLLEDATPVKHLHALLEGANAATDATVRARFLAATWSIRWEADEADEEPSAETPADEAKDDKVAKNDEPPAERKVTEPEAVVWRKLLADTRSVPSQFNPQNRFQESGSSTKPTIAELAATAFETSIQPGVYGEAHAAAIILDKTANAILVERANARLAGKPAPPLPDAAKVTEERLGEIVAAAGKKAAAEIHPFLTSLTPDERAAWLKWFNDPGDLPWPESVKSLQHVITRRSTDENSYFPDLKGAGNIDVGFNLAADNLTKHIESLAAEADKHSRTYIGISPVNFGPGLELITSIFPLQPEPAKAPSPGTPDEPRDRTITGAQVFSQAISALNANESATAVAMAYAGSRQASNRAVWLVQDGKAKLQAPGEGTEVSEEPFAATLAKLFESDQHERFYLSIQILTRADADKFTAAAAKPDASGDSPDSEDSSTPTEEDESP